MSVVNRSLKNVLRKPTRALGVIIIIGVSLGIFLSMSIINDSISDRSMELSGDLETRITIAPAGAGPKGGETLDGNVSIEVESLAADPDNHITSVQQLVTHRTWNETTSEKRFVIGQDPGAPLVPYGGGSITMESGRGLDHGDVGENVALIGIRYPDDSVTVGNTLIVSGLELLVVGNFSAEGGFSETSIIAPIDVVQEAFAISGAQIIYVEVDYLGNMDHVEELLKEELEATVNGTTRYDIAPLADMESTALQDSLNAIMANSELGASFSLVTAATVMVFIMVLITRERIQEIGVLKAIGFKDSRILSQFFVESSVLATIGFVVALVFALVAGPSIQSFMVENETDTNPLDSGKGGGGKGGGGRTSAMGGSGEIEVADFSLSGSFILYTLILALILGLVGALYPIIKALMLKPAEALRYE